MLKDYRTIFVTGIDTDAGKTYATALLARLLGADGSKVITQKFIQTGCRDTSEDIEKHRALLGTGTLPEDREGLTAPVIFTYPASAQLAARIDGREIDLSVIDRAREVLESRFDHVLVEGAGGLMVPITDNFMAIDYVSSRNLPAVLVTNSRLGSINHTILSLEAIAAHGIELAGVVFNHHYDSDALIAADTRDFVRRYVSRHFPGAEWVELEEIC